MSGKLLTEVKYICPISVNTCRMSRSLEVRVGIDREYLQLEQIGMIPSCHTYPSHLCSKLTLNQPLQTQ